MRVLANATEGPASLTQDCQISQAWLCPARPLHGTGNLPTRLPLCHQRSQGPCERVARSSQPWEALRHRDSALSGRRCCLALDVDLMPCRAERPQRANQERWRPQGSQAQGLPACGRRCRVPMASAALPAARFLDCPPLPTLQLFFAFHGSPVRLLSRTWELPVTFGEVEPFAHDRRPLSRC